MDSISEALEKVRLENLPPKSEKIQLPEAEDEENEEYIEDTAPLDPFPFFDLPSELRLRVYHILLFTPRRKRAHLHTKGSVGASKKNPPLSPTSHRINLFLVSRRVHDEASDYFYTTQTFRLFPLQDYSRMPTISMIPPRYRPSIATIELILGSSWTAPPSSWKVNRRLGLEEMVRAKTLKVFIEVDPSHPVFEGFRISKNFYTEFSGGILRDVLAKMPSLEYVEFDGWPSVRKNGALMQRLLHEAKAAEKKIAWAPSADGQTVMRKTWTFPWFTS
ncbi:hypothetical protein ANOM_007010 [Aspergillus nomiae NRRL 13137]|uniref:Uncharacterized protein n=1 Tax=Aspergillus nomiae NRRL (strain ATCC 15546 / NRRL 13137 / CBS 260.88 / M93) TaxID=1509407 RepID=A0A0L1IXI3_ASPN3|nr:uncharacterized protein ANOM_007010 [Aspergillus nomiae NRRL 13137]KNG84207.1 hypothetical protein ANOM_007010 [Aspergillus nomiae NRRL 13137]